MTIEELRKNAAYLEGRIVELCNKVFSLKNHVCGVDTVSIESKARISKLEATVETHDRFQFIPCDAMEQRVQKLERLAAYPSTPFQINTSSDILTIHKLQQEKSVLQETVVEGKLSYERLSEENKTLKATVDEQRDELYRVKTIVIAAKDNLSGL